MPLTWCLMLCVQALLGDGVFAVPTPVLPWERGFLSRMVTA